MKKYTIILLAALSLGSFTACDDVLDVEPTTAIEADGAVVDFTTLNRSALGVYSAMQSTNYYGLRYLIYQDVYADNMAHSGTFTTDREVSSRRLNASNLQLASTWATMYTTINRANIVLRDADRLTNISDVERNTIKGEMLFIRGLVHFDLVKVFGPIPYITSPTTTIEEIQSLGKTAVNQVYDNIIADLQQSESLLGTATRRDPRRASGLAAAALQARVQLQRGNNAQAEAKADQVITSGRFALQANFADLFTNEGISNTESIFELDFTLNDANGLGSASDPTTAGQKFYLRAGAFNALSASAQNGDTRFAATTRTQNSRMRLLKYEDVANNADNVIIIRLAEMYLIRAEAKARQGVAALPADPQVISDINQIRVRAKLQPLLPLSLTNAQALTEILQQRRLEFVGEGMRFMDLKRYNLTCDVLGFCDEEAFRNLWPIPLQQLEVNPNLEPQNPGY